MKKWLIALAVILLLSLPACIALFGSGYLGFFNPDVSVAHVASVRVTDGRTSGESIEITDQENIGLITDVVNDLSPAVGRSSTKNGWLYSVTFLDTSGNEIFHITVVDDDEISFAEHFYAVDSTDLIACLDRFFPG